MFQLLLEKKCDLDLCDEINGNTPIMLATSLNQVINLCFLKCPFLIVYLSAGDSQETYQGGG